MEVLKEVLMLKAVIFDMDGVILDSEPVYHRIEMEMFGDLGIKLADEDRYKYVGTKTWDMWSELKELYNLSYSVEELVEMEAGRYRKCLESGGGVKLIPGVLKLVRGLHAAGVRLAIASSSLRENIETMLDTFALRKYFSVTVSGDEIALGKPSPGIFLKAAELLGVNPEECVVIEDSKNGVLAAGAAGMKCIGYNNPAFAIQDVSMADYVTGRLEELDYMTLERIIAAGTDNRCGNTAGTDRWC